MISIELQRPLSYSITIRKSGGRCILDTYINDFIAKHIKTIFLFQGQKMFVLDITIILQKRWNGTTQYKSIGVLQVNSIQTFCPILSLKHLSDVITLHPINSYVQVSLFE